MPGGGRSIVCPSGGEPRNISDMKPNMSGVPSMYPPFPLNVPESTNVERDIPIIVMGIVATIPASGPAMPMSKRAFLEYIGDFIFMNAPNVPMGEIYGGAGMKYGGVMSMPYFLP